MPALCETDNFATVFHLVSDGDRRAASRRHGALDLLACAAFPGGSITGAPRIRAMESHRRELEPRAAGLLRQHRLSSDSTAPWTTKKHQSSRTLCGAHDRRASVSGAAAGIVADSRPADEYDETIAEGGAHRRIVGDPPGLILRRRQLIPSSGLALSARARTQDRSYNDRHRRRHARLVVRHTISSRPTPCTPNEAGVSAIASWVRAVPIPACASDISASDRPTGTSRRAGLHGRTSLVRHVGEGVFARHANRCKATRYQLSSSCRRTGCPTRLIATAWQSEIWRCAIARIRSWACSSAERC